MAYSSAGLGGWGDSSALISLDGGKAVHNWLAVATSRSSRPDVTDEAAIAAVMTAATGSFLTGLAALASQRLM